MSLAWADIAIFAVLALSVLVGLWRGLLFEVLSLLGWVVAYFAAQALGPQMAHWVRVGAQGSGLNQVVGWAAVFLIVLVIWSLGARLVRMLVAASPLSGLDRLMGAGFGFIRGALICLLAVLVAGMTPVRQSRQWQDSKLLPWVQVVLLDLKPVLPPILGQYVRL